MKILDKMMDHICDELEGAWEYAEKYLENKAKGDQRSSKYREMALDEIHHAEILYSFAVDDIEKLERFYTLTGEEEEKWEHTKKKFTERVAFLKHTLTS